MEENEVFCTQQGYSNIHSGLSASMEDYLEMIYRFCMQYGYVRVSTIAHKLSVSSSSASKMAAKLNNAEYVSFRPYGIITLTEKGKKLGSYLLHRHDTVKRFLCYLNNSENQLNEAEQIEHFLSETTVINLDKLLEKLTKGKE